MPDAVYYVANIAALKAINTTDMANGARRVVGTPATGHLPSWYTLFKGVTRTEILPVIVVPTTVTTDVWIADTARIITATTVPTSPPAFIGQRYIVTGTSPVQLYEAVGTSSSAQWVRI